MSQRRVLNFVAAYGLLLAILLFGLFAGGGHTQAQPALEMTPGATPSPEPVRPAPRGPQSAQPAPVMDGPEDVAAPQVGIQYLSVTGSAFMPLASSTTYLYSVGCVVPLGGGQFTFPVQLPYNSTVTQLRLYYDDSNATTDGELTLASYDNGPRATISIASVKTTGAPGWSTATLNFSHKLDYDLYSYALLWSPNVSDISVQLCNARIGYVPPGIFGLALPVVTK